MPLPFIGALGRAGRRALSFIGSGVRRGLSLLRLENVLRVTGLGVRREELTRAVAHVQQLITGGERLRSLRRDQFPNLDLLPVAKTTLRRQLSFNVRLRGTRISTGERVERFVTLTTDVNLRRATIEDFAARNALILFEKYDLELADATLMEGLQAGQRGIF